MIKWQPKSSNIPPGITRNTQECLFTLRSKDEWKLVNDEGGKVTWGSRDKLVAALKRVLYFEDDDSVSDSYNRERGDVALIVNQDICGSYMKIAQRSKFQQEGAEEAGAGPWTAAVSEFYGPRARPTEPQHIKQAVQNLLEQFFEVGDLDYAHTYVAPI